MKVKITESNFRKIYREIPPEHSDISYIETLLKKDIKSFFVKKEIEIIASVKAAIEVMQDYSTFIKKIPTKKIDIEKANPKTRLIFLKSTPAYHHNNLCTRLHSEYKNYEIPIEVPEERVEEYREFFIDNIDLYREKLHIFFARVELNFGLRIRIIREIEKPNSGLETIMDFEVEPENKLLTDIHNLGNEMIQFRFSSEERRKAIQKYGMASHIVAKGGKKIIASQEDENIIKTWFEYKVKMKNKIIKYIIIKFNPDMIFDKTCLEYFGFKPCADCSSESVKLKNELM